MPRCARCSGFGHEESACPSDATILVMELSDNDPEEQHVFAASATGKCTWRIGEEVGDEESDKQVAQYIADSGATCHTTPNADGLTNYRECSRPLGFVDRRKISIAGYGDLTVAFRSNDSWVHVKLHDVARVPLLSYNLVSLISLPQEGHPSAVEESEVALKLKGGGTVQFPLIGSFAANMGTALRRQVGWQTLLVPLFLLGKRKLQPPRLTTTFSTAFTATPTRHCSSKRRSTKESTSARSFTSTGDAQW